MPDDNYSGHALGLSAPITKSEEVAAATNPAPYTPAFVSRAVSSVLEQTAEIEFADDADGTIREIKLLAGQVYPYRVKKVHLVASPILLLS